MAVTPSGTISMSNLNTALGRSSTASISMSDAQIYLLAGTATSGTINMNSIRNKTTFNGTITVGTIYDKGNLYGYSSPGGLNFGGPVTGTLYGGTITTFTSYDGAPEQIIVANTSSVPSYPPQLLYRCRVGTGPVVATWNNSTQSSLYEVYGSPLNMGASDVGQTRNWQFVLI